MRKRFLRVVNVIAMVASAHCTATTNEASVDQEQVLFEKSPIEGQVASALLRPQEPKPPYSYNEEAVKYSNSNAGISLAATLTLPRSEGPHPAVILIAGSGRCDRDEEIFGHKPFLVLADHLTKQGLAVLRFDKRGCAESTGNYDTATSRDFTDDVLTGVDYLKTRKEIDARRIGLIGHSEGGIIAPMVATQSEDVAFIVLMAGTGVNGEEILYAQGALVARSMGASVEVIAHQEDAPKPELST